MSATTWTLAAPARELLIQAAFDAKAFAYSRYSNFHVGAALLAANGELIKGANVDNASYGGTICAERTAIVKAVSEGTRAFVALAVVTDAVAPVSPCGLCRQVLREFCAPDMAVLLVPADYKRRQAEGKADGGVLETSIGELLPHGFGPGDLQLPKVV